MEITDYSANDNTDAAPVNGATALYRGDSVGRQMEARNKASNIVPHPNFSFPAAKKGGGGTGTGGERPSFLSRPSGFFAVFFLWIMSLAGAFMAVEQYNEPIPRIFISVGCAWAALFFAYVSRKQNRDWFQALGLTGALIALGAAVLMAVSGYNIPLSLSLLASLAVFTTILLAALLKEQYLLIISGLITLGWMAYSFANPEISAHFWTFPALWAMQMFLAMELNAKTPLAIATIAGVFGLFTSLYVLTATQQISALMAIAAMFMIGIVHSRVGKSMQDSQILSGLLQTNIGWAIAALSALLLQDYWLMSTPHMPWVGLSTTPTSAYPLSKFWNAFTIIGIAAVGVLCLFRIHAKKQSFIGGLGVVGFASILPASIAYKPRLIALAEQYNIAPVPNIGLLIGGTITGLALGMLVNGLRRNKTSMIMLALLTLCAEAVLIMDNLYAEPDNQAVFGFTIMIVALTAGLYAHNGRIREQRVQIHV